MPLFAAQYALAIFCLTRLAFCNISIKKYMVWNLVCLVVFFVGSAVFLVYYYTHKSILVPKKEHKQDYIVKDVNVGDVQDTTIVNDVTKPENMVAESGGINDTTGKIVGASNKIVDVADTIDDNPINK